MKRALVLFLVLCSFACFGCAGDKTSASAPSPIRTMTAREALAMIETEKDYTIVDVRTPEEFSDVRVKGAINIPVESIGELPPSQLVGKKDSLIFVYCRTGRRSAIAAEKLAKMGYKNIVDFGGIVDYVGPVETGSKK